jgi:hypothetical protein
VIQWWAIERRHGWHDCNEQFSSRYSLLGQEERWSCVYRRVRFVFEFALLQMYRILDVHFALHSLGTSSGSTEKNRTNNISLINQPWPLTNDTCHSAQWCNSNCNKIMHAYQIPSNSCQRCVISFSVCSIEVAWSSSLVDFLIFTSD